MEPGKVVKSDAVETLPVTSKPSFAIVVETTDDANESRTVTKAFGILDSGNSLGVGWGVGWGGERGAYFAISLSSRVIKEIFSLINDY